MLEPLPALGTSIDRYSLVRAIASGAGGVVYEAIDSVLQRRVALKLLHARADATPEAKRAEARFVREGQIASRIRHPHVVDLLDLGVSGGVPFLVMELVEGETLRELLEREGPLPVDRAIEIVLPLVSAVAELHGQGVVHRDIKPANVLMASGRGLWPKLADFGVSSCDDGVSSLTAAGTMIGTPEYMAPELIEGTDPANERTDQYALAVLLYECVTGVRPFEGDTPYQRLHAAVCAELVPPSARAHRLCAAFDAVVLRALHRCPERRFAGVAAFAESLLPFASGPVAARWQDEFEGALSPSPSPPESGGPPPASRESPMDLSVATYDGVAVAIRGDTLTQLWSAPPRLARTRWVFDLIDRCSAERPDGLRVLMVILPTADPPDGPARMENDRRLRAFAGACHGIHTVILGDGVWQVLIRSVVRSMMLPHRRTIGGPTTVHKTLAEGIGRLRLAASPRTPSFECLFEDVRELYKALGQVPPELPEGVRPRSEGSDRPSRRMRRPALRA